MEQSSPQQKLKDRLLTRIETEHVCPRSRLFFTGRELVMWSLWVVSVVVGALAIAVSLFVVLHRQYALYEATHDNFLTFMVAVLPYVWIITFGVMVFVAVYNIRHTKRGYRYPLSVILLSSVTLSVIGGFSLQLLGLGYSIDHELGKYMPVYRSQDKVERTLWQAPESGRLVGRQVVLSGTTTMPDVVLFEDIDGVVWELNISEMNQRDMELLASNADVRLLGMASDGETAQFHGCGVFPWMFDKNMPSEELDAERQHFLERVNELAHSPEARAQLLETKVYEKVIEEIEEDVYEESESEGKSEDACATIAAVRRTMAHVPVFQPQ